jgi:hypothetical protein
MLHVEFKLTTPALERTKSVHSSDLETTVMWRPVGAAFINNCRICEYEYVNMCRICEIGCIFWNCVVVDSEHLLPQGFVSLKAVSKSGKFR